MLINKKLRVLLIEDDPDNHLAFEFSKGEEWDITRYKHPYLADASDIDNYDVLFLDIVFNIKDDDIRKIPSSWIDASVFTPARDFIKSVLAIKPNFPIILLTALNKEQISKDSDIFDINAKILHMNKPTNFNSDEFSKTVAQFIQNTSA